MHAAFRAAAAAALVGFSATAPAGDDSRAPQPSPLGRQIADFSLQDYSGRIISLSELDEADAVVVLFLGTECPLVKLYAQRLARLAQSLATRNVAFLGINANLQDSLTEIMYYARANDIKFPILKDLHHEVADRFGAERTPEAFVLDRRRVIRYRGRIDDQYGVGYSFREPRRDDLRIAVEEVLSGGEVSQPLTPAVGCLIGRAREPNEACPVVWSRQIVRIFQNRCVSCHRPGEIGPFSLENYADALGWAPMIQEVVQQQRMPPWPAERTHGVFTNEPYLSDEEVRLINEWVDNGAPEGDPADLPPPREFIDGWKIQPDLIFYATERPYHVPAEGRLELPSFTVKTNFREGKWIKAAECRPGNLEVVHHINVFVKNPEGTDEDLELLWGWVPGLRPMVLEEGMAKYVHAGAELLFVIHYTPNGYTQLDRTMFGVQFARPEEVRQRVRMMRSDADLDFLIPPHAPNHEVSTSYTIEQDARLVSLYCHMHLRGKDAYYEAVYPDGRREKLLNIPRYDFNWQFFYNLVEPKPLPAGTRILCTAHFDNSEDNAANPDPSAAVIWGEATEDEMLQSFFELAYPAPPELAAGADRPNWTAGGSLSAGALVAVAVGWWVIQRRRHRGAPASD